MIGHLIDHADMLKNQCGYSTLWVIVPECVPSDETVLNDDKEEDEDDAKADNWSVGRRNKRSRNKHDSDEVANDRNTCELREIDAEENDEHKKR